MKVNNAARVMAIRNVSGAASGSLARGLDKGGDHPRKSIRLIQIHEVAAVLELHKPSTWEVVRQRAQTGGDYRAVVLAGDHQCGHRQGLETCETIPIHPRRHNRSIHL